MAFRASCDLVCGSAAPTSAPPWQPCPGRRHPQPSATFPRRRWSPPPSHGLVGTSRLRSPRALSVATSSEEVRADSSTEVTILAVIPRPRPRQRAVLPSPGRGGVHDNLSHSRRAALSIETTFPHGVPVDLFAVAAPHYIPLCPPAAATPPLMAPARALVASADASLAELRATEGQRRREGLSGETLPPPPRVSSLVPSAT